MRTGKLRFLALLLALAMLLSGCRLSLLIDLLEQLSTGGEGIVHYSDMEYTRPDMEHFRQVLEKSCETARTSETFPLVVSAINAFYGVYDDFYTNYNLADVRYSRDLTDVYWEAEQSFCMENAAEVDAGLEELYYALAESPVREHLEGEDYFGPGYFDAYEGDSPWDPGFLKLMEKEAALLGEYYDLVEASGAEEYYSDAYFDHYTMPMTELFVELIRVRQEIADYIGYGSYADFAYDQYYYRDYTAAQAVDYLARVRDTLYQQYCGVSVSEIWDTVSGYCSEADTFAYVKTAAEAMGGDIAQAFSLLEKAGLCDIAYGENKYDTSYEVYLWNYASPFVYMCPYQIQTDKLTFAHEFGHFANDYVCGGSYVGTDIAEVHSQAFEYLSLCYGENTQALAKYKMADSLCTYMENAAYAMFEHQVYGLTGDALTAEAVLDLYRQIGSDYGFDSVEWDPRDLITIPHFFTQPMYVISYVVSNDVAMQLYQRELQSAGAGLEAYAQCLYSQDSYIIAFAQQYGLESPFAEGRLEKVSQTFQTALK